MTRLLRRVDPYLLLLWALCIPALAMLFAPGYFFSAHDGRHSVFYQNMFDASLRSGALWPRWAMHHSHGYGYPTFIILAPLGFYLGELFVLAGASFTTAARLAWATGFLVSAWGMYRLVLHWLRDEPEHAVEARTVPDATRLAAVAAGLLYVYTPYHMVDMVVRGALNDSLLLAWFPWVFLAFDRLIVLGGTPGWTRRLALAILAFAGTLLTHSFAMLSFAPLLISFVLFRLALVAQRGRRAPAAKRRFAQSTALAAAAGAGALLIFAVFLLPLLAEVPYLRQDVYVSDTYNYRNHFVYFGQYFSPAWGFGYSDDPDGANDGMSFAVGALAVILALAAAYLLAQRNARPARRAEMIYLLAAAIGVLLIMLPLSAPLWDALPPLAVIQFPWRLLALVSFTLSALGGLVVGNLARSAAGSDTPAGSGAAAGGVLAVALLAVFSGAAYAEAPLQPVEPWREDGRAVFQFESEHPDMFGYTVWMTEPFTSTEMSDEYAAAGYAEVNGRNTTLERLTILEGEGRVVSVFSHGSRFGGAVDMATAGVVRVNMAYFPGWRATVDGAPVALRVSPPRGLVEVDVPAGRHAVEIRMGATPARRAGTIAAWLGLGITAALLVWPRRRTHELQIEVHHSRE